MAKLESKSAEVVEIPLDYVGNTLRDLAHQYEEYKNEVKFRVRDLNLDNVRQALHNHMIGHGYEDLKELDSALNDGWDSGDFLDTLNATISAAKASAYDVYGSSRFGVKSKYNFYNVPWLRRPFY